MRMRMRVIVPFNQLSASPFIPHNSQRHAITWNLGMEYPMLGVCVHSIERVRHDES